MEQLSKTLPPEVLKKVEEVANSRNCSSEWLILQAVKEYLDRETWQTEEINKGLKEAEEGILIPHDQVVKKWESKLSSSNQIHS